MRGDASAGLPVDHGGETQEASGNERQDQPEGEAYDFVNGIS